MPDSIPRRTVRVRRVDECETLDDVFLHCLPAFGGAYLRRIYSILDRAIASTGFKWQITGYDILARGTGGDSAAPSVLFETALGALAVLLFVFASFLALVPLLIAAVSILSGLSPSRSEILSTTNAPALVPARSLVEKSVESLDNS